MSEREPSGYGAFVVGLALGAVLGLLFAPEGGRASRAKMGRRLKTLRGLATEVAGELGELVSKGAGEEDEPLV